MTNKQTITHDGILASVDNKNCKAFENYAYLLVQFSKIGIKLNIVLWYKFLEINSIQSVFLMYFAL